jgi:hypothetical protein
MRDRTAARRYSPERDEFRRDHERQRAWGLQRRHAERLRRLRAAGPADANGSCQPHREGDPHPSRAPGITRAERPNCPAPSRQCGRPEPRATSRTPGPVSPPPSSGPRPSGQDGSARPGPSERSGHVSARRAEDPRPVAPGRRGPASKDQTGDGPPESAGSRLRAARPVSRLKPEAKGLRRSHPASQIPPLTAAERYHHAHPRGRATHSIRHDQTDLPAAAHPHPGRHDHTPPHATPHPTRAGTTDPTPRGPAPVQAGTTPRPPASPRPAPLRDRSRLAQGGNAAGLSSGRKRPPPVTDG